MRGKGGSGLRVCARSCRRRRRWACALVALTALSAGTPTLQHGAAAVELAPGGTWMGALTACGPLLRLRGAGQTTANRSCARARPPPSVHASPLGSALASRGLRANEMRVCRVPTGAGAAAAGDEERVGIDVGPALCTAHTAPPERHELTRKMEAVWRVADALRRRRTQAAAAPPPGGLGLEGASVGMCTLEKRQGLGDARGDVGGTCDDDLQELLSLLQDQSALLRHEVCYAMGQTGLAQAAPALVDILQNTRSLRSCHPSVCFLACRNLHLTPAPAASLSPARACAARACAQVACTRQDVMACGRAAHRLAD